MKESLRAAAWKVLTDGATPRCAVGQAGRGIMPW
jgi:hypothetical protein